MTIKFQLKHRDEPVLRNTCANSIPVKKSTKYTWFLKGHDTTNTTHNKCTETQVILLHLYTRDAIISHPVDILNKMTDSQASIAQSGENEMVARTIAGSSLRHSLLFDQIQELVSIVNGSEKIINLVL